MAEPNLTIRDLRIRVPGVSQADAMRLGEAVARELANHPPQSAAPRAIDHLTVRMHGTMDHGTSQLATKIAASVRKGIR